MPRWSRSSASRYVAAASTRHSGSASVIRLRHSSSSSTAKTLIMQAHTHKSIQLPRRVTQQAHRPATPKKPCCDPNATRMPSAAAKDLPSMLLHQENPTLDTRPLHFPDRMHGTITADRLEGRLDRGAELTGSTHADRDGRGDGPAPVAAVDELAFLVHDRAVAVALRDERHVLAV